MLYVAFKKRNFIILVFLITVILFGCEKQPEKSTGNDEFSLDKYAYVKFVIDGDTIVLQNDEKVRYIGIDTPEIGECYYNEARLKNIELVYHKTVFLDVCEKEPTDKYGRTLAYVYVNDLFVNAELLKGGYARTLTIPPCIDHAQEFKQYEKQAKEEGRGMWSDCY